MAGRGTHCSWLRERRAEAEAEPESAHEEPPLTLTPEESRRKYGLGG